MGLPLLSPYIASIAILVALFGAWTVHRFQFRFWQGLAGFLGAVALLIGAFLVHWAINRRIEKRRILFIMDEGIQKTPYGPEDYYLLNIINESQSSIELTHVWLELGKGKKVHLAQCVSHLPVTVPRHGTWKGEIMKLLAPNLKNWSLSGRAKLLDGRLLRSAPFGPHPYVRPRVTTL
jgi:hypothetical protein